MAIISMKWKTLIEIDNTFRDLRSMNEEEGESDANNSTGGNIVLFYFMNT
jgi:hypothetical protein